MAMNSQPAACVDYCSPVRNRYFYGKLLDVFHFELEQNYFNTKRWMLNRFVLGYGVICGLNVQLGSDNQSVYVTPGLAIDKCGREIIVCQPSDPIALPPPPPAPSPGPASGTVPTPGTTGPAMGAAGTAPAAAGTSSSSGSTSASSGSGCCEPQKYVHLLICYYECPSDPVPALGGDCDTQAMCSPGAIRERYQLKLVDGKLPAARTTSSIPDVFSNGTLNYPALANYVRGQSLTNPICDCCIPLANIRIPGAGQSYNSTNIDISVGPLVYGNDLLYEMVLALKTGPSSAGISKP
jgi:hypothetical protein